MASLNFDEFAWEGDAIVQKALARVRAAHPQAPIYGFKRRGREDRIVVLPQSAGSWVKAHYMEANAARAHQKQTKVLGEPWVVWESVGTKRYGRLRQSPSRVTRAGVDLQELPLPQNSGREPLDALFADWLSHWQITGSGSCPRYLAILRGAFAIGILSQEQDSRTQKRIARPRLALDQNQHVGNRTHLLIEDGKPQRPFALHILLYAGPAFEFEVTGPSMSSRFKARESRPQAHLLAQAPNDKVRFYLNEKHLAEGLSMHVYYWDALQRMGEMANAMCAAQCLLDYANALKKQPA